MQSLRRFLIFFLIPFVCFAQEDAPSSNLLNEAKTKLYNKPAQAAKIAEYIISLKGHGNINIEATLLLSQSYYIRGNYNDAVKFALNAKKMADSSNDLDLRFATYVFAIRLIRELDLETVADKYRDELHKLVENSKRENLQQKYQEFLTIDSTLGLFKNEKFKDALDQLNMFRSSFPEGNNGIIFENNITKAEILVQSKALIQAENLLDSVYKLNHSDFEILQLNAIQGQLYFKKKEFEKSILSFKKVLELALNLPSKKYEHMSLEGLTNSYLALEDSPNFFTYKQQNNLASIQVDNDRNLAINTVYNFINSSQKEQAKAMILHSRQIVYILCGVLFLCLILGLALNYSYSSKTKELLAIYKYVSPKEKEAITEAQKIPVKKSSSIPEETEHILLKKLKKFETSTKFTDPDMSIAMLATQFDTNTKYLSEIINRQKEKNFNGYINELRINYIIEKLKTDPVYFNYKVSYLAEESGFSSHSSFTTVFKSVTGISPTKFMELLQQQKKSI